MKELKVPRESRRASRECLGECLEDLLPIDGAASLNDLFFFMKVVKAPRSSKASLRYLALENWLPPSLL